MRSHVRLCPLSTLARLRRHRSRRGDEDSGIKQTSINGFDVQDQLIRRIAVTLPEAGRAAYFPEHSVVASFGELVPCNNPTDPVRLPVDP